MTDFFLLNVNYFVVPEKSCTEIDPLFWINNSVSTAEPARNGRIDIRPPAIPDVTINLPQSPASKPIRNNFQSACTGFSKSQNQQLQDISWMNLVCASS